MNRCPFVVRYL